MAETLTKFGEDYETHVKRAGQALADLRDGEWEDRVKFPHNRIYPGTRLSEATFDIELEAMIETNPNTSAEEKAKTLTILKRIQEEEIEKRIKEREKRIREAKKLLPNSC